MLVDLYIYLSLSLSLPYNDIEFVNSITSYQLT